MDKEEAMKILKDFHDKSALFSVRTALDTISPELRESEGERIRKKLIHLVKKSHEQGGYALHKWEADELLAWLEKQGSEPNWCHHKVDLSNCSEEYRKAYYDGWNNCNQQHSQCKSEENDVVKCLINGMKFYYEGNEEATWGTEKFPMKVRDILSWLEKQGYTKKDVDDAYLKGICNTKHELEKQGEQESADKHEPKFHEGEWITNGDYTWKIVEVKSLDYILQSQDGNIVDDAISYVDKQFHSFTIEDAKDGDTLINKNYMGESPFIFKETKPSNIKTDVSNPLTIFGYCGIGGAGFTKSSGWGDTANCIYHPATKEQRDTLFLKMKEAGYEWSEETHKLKKISQRMVSAEAKEALYDKPTDEEMKELLRTEYEKGRADTIAEMQKGWSEEDERNLGLTEYAVMKFFGGDCSLVDWLRKSLKDRITWKPSDAQMASITCAVRNMKESACYDSELVSLFNDLKKLKG